MENKFLGYENEEELSELVNDEVTASGGITGIYPPTIPVPILITLVICPTGACTNRC